MTKKNDKSDNILIFPLTYYWWDKVRNGTKTSVEENGKKYTIEYRRARGRYWDIVINVLLKNKMDSYVIKLGACPHEIINPNHVRLDFQDKHNFFGVFQKGYSQERLGGRIHRIELINGEKTDLEIYEPVLAFWIEEPKKCYINYYPKCYDKNGDYYIQEYTDGYEYVDYYYYPCDSKKDGICYTTTEEAKEVAFYNLGNGCCDDYNKFRFYHEKHIYIPTEATT